MKILKSAFRIPQSAIQKGGTMGVKTPIVCRVCGKKLGVVRDFEGRIFTLCVACEKALKEANKRRAR